MRNEVIHQKYSLQVPDQYETLSEADLRQMYRSGRYKKAPSRVRIHQCFEKGP